MSGSVPPLDTFVLDTITMEPAPQKKGLILRHVEYLVRSDHFRSEVTRRYSDFQALNELLLYRCLQCVCTVCVYSVYSVYSVCTMCTGVIITHNTS